MKEAKDLEASMRNLEKYTRENPYYVEDGAEEIEENEEEFTQELNLPSHVGSHPRLKIVANWLDVQLARQVSTKKAKVFQSRHRRVRVEPIQLYALRRRQSTTQDRSRLQVQCILS